VGHARDVRARWSGTAPLHAHHIGAGGSPVGQPSLAGGGSSVAVVTRLRTARRTPLPGVPLRATAALHDRSARLHLAPAAEAVAAAIDVVPTAVDPGAAADALRIVRCEEPCGRPRHAPER